MLQIQSWLKTVKQRRGRIAVMGILNVTPDSFSDGGQFVTTESIQTAAALMIEEGVDIIDIGGESTRPGSDPVSLPDELERVIPAIRAIREFSDIPISIDTYKPEVMRAAIEAGANLINDVNALQAEGARQVAADLAVPVCLMHKKGTPKTMQESPEYQSVAGEVFAFLQEQKALCIEAGVSAEQIMLDPGFGFGKRLEDNIHLFQQIPKMWQLDAPILIGVSRKSMIGQILQIEDPQERLIGSVTAAVLAAQKGAAIVRVHDVKETVHALQLAAVLD